MSDIFNGESLPHIDEATLLSLASSGEELALAALLTRYAPLVKAKAAPFRTMGLDTDDLVQEGMLGLFSAVYSYDSSFGASFSTFAGVVVSRRILSAVKAASRQKHQPLSNYLPLSSTESENASFILMDHSDNPESKLIQREEYTRIIRYIYDLLSDFELKVLKFYLSGHSYDDIASRLSCSPKSVDNAMQRTRRKLQSIHF